MRSGSFFVQRGGCLLVLFVLASSHPASAQEPASGEVRTWKDAMGYSLDYPAAWQIQETEQGLVLVPGDAAKDAMGNPLELFILGSEGAEGLSGPDDPVVGQYLMTQLGGGFQQVGEPSAVRTGLGEGAAWTFEGAFPGGPPVKSTIHVVVHEGTGLFLMDLSTTEHAGKRKEEVGGILESLSYSRPAFDPDLLGTWTRQTTEGSSGFGGGVFANTSTSYSFQADGMVLYGSRSRIDGTTSGVTAYSDSGGQVSRGTFGTSDGHLTIRWEDGTVSSFEYRVFLDHEGNPALKLQIPGEDPVYYHGG